jgi:hypothetical protein
MFVASKNATFTLTGTGNAPDAGMDRIGDESMTWRNALDKKNQNRSVVVALGGAP